MIDSTVANGNFNFLRRHGFDDQFLGMVRLGGRESSGILDENCGDSRRHDRRVRPGLANHVGGFAHVARLFLQLSSPREKRIFAWLKKATWSFKTVLS